MIIREMSDLHLEVCPYLIPPMTGDEEATLVLSGDICSFYSLNEKVIDFFKSASARFKHIVYVPGNHEYYGENIDNADNIIKKFFDKHEISNVHFLNMGDVVIDDVAFIGATLWTDVNRGNPMDQRFIENALSDFRLIKIGDNRRVLRAEDTMDIHEWHKAYLFEKVVEHRSAGRKTVVISHHAPSELSVHKKWKNSNINAAFHSRLSDEVMDGGPDLWFHGHMHDNFDYTLGNTRVICNPRGYANIMNIMGFKSIPSMPVVDVDDPNSGVIMANFYRIFQHENQFFDPFLTLEI